MRTITLAFVCALFAACSWGTGSPGEGDDEPSVDAAVSSPAVCGDAVCAASEVGSCTQDCGSSTNMCGNSTCDAGETNASCPADCPVTGPVCGDGTCDMAGGENSTNCAGDCTASSTCPADPLACFTCAIDGTGCPAGHDMTSCTACIFMM